MTDRKSSEATPPQSTKATIARVARVARLMQWVCMVGILIFVFELIVTWDTQLRLSAGEGLQVDNTFSPTARNWSTGLAKLPYVVSVLMAFYFAVQTFGYLKRGDILTEPSATSLNRMSWAAFAATIAHILMTPIASLLGATGQINIIVHDVHLVIMFLCLVILAMSWILREASKQVEDVKLIF